MRDNLAIDRLVPTMDSFIVVTSKLDEKDSNVAIKLD